MELTAEDLQAIRERVNKATPGPWLARRKEVDWSEIPQPLLVVSKGGDIVGQTYVGMAQGCFYNAEFIAHARTDLPRALDALDAAEKENERLRGALKFYANEDDYCQYGESDILHDRGEEARQALAGDSQ